MYFERDFSQLVPQSHKLWVLMQPPGFDSPSLNYTDYSRRVIDVSIKRRRRGKQVFRTQKRADVVIEIHGTLIVGASTEVQLKESERL